MKTQIKKILVCAVVASMATSMFAQEQGKVRGGINVGAAIPDGGVGLVFDLNLGYKLADNMTVGARYGSALIAKASPDGTSGSVSGNGNIIGTFDYYLNPGGRSFAPFAGVGAGLYTVASVAAGTGFIGADAGNKFGGLLTAGFELGRFRVAAEYNLIPATEVTMLLGGTEKVQNSYLAVTLGFYIGGGKWGRDKR